MLTQKQENFVNNLFQGMTQREAYVEAYKPRLSIKDIDSSASRLSSIPKVSARLEEMRQAAKGVLIADAVERKERLTEIVRAKITDYQTSDGIYIDEFSPNAGAIEGMEMYSRTSRDSLAGTITIKRPVVPESVRNAIFKRDGNKCVLCSSTVNLQLDHIKSLSKGGKTEESNLQTLCEECNKAKGAGKKSQAVITKLKLHSPLQAIDIMNKMDGVYDERTPWVNDNRSITIIVSSEQAKQLTEGIKEFGLWKDK